MLVFLTIRLFFLERQYAELKDNLGKARQEQEQADPELSERTQIETVIDIGTVGGLSETEELTETESDTAFSVERPAVSIADYEAGMVLGEAEVCALEQTFQSYEISDAVLSRIYGNSYVDNENVAISDLRYLKVLHYNFAHEIQVGELIVNAELAQDFLEIFQELFEYEYEIHSMYLIDDFWTGEGDSSDSASIEANNTSAFCYRAVTGGSALSNHAYGRAIDINPQQNPYVWYYDGQPAWSHENANDYVDRSSGYEHVITHEDVCYQVFTAHGFAWGGDWNNPKDYQHFEK